MILFIFVLLFHHAFSYINVTGVRHGQDPQTGQWPIRQEISVIAQGKEMWDLYIQALLAFQNAPSDDPLSFYQIAGIHGYPVIPWDGIGGSGNAGFCMHNSVLFPIWHRPYLALYEQILCEHAYEIAQEYPLEDRSTYLEAANSLRIPYWDWALSGGLPSVMTQRFLQITTPTGLQTLQNPLYQYDFPFDMDAIGRFPAVGGSALLLNLTSTVKHYNLTSKVSDLDSVSMQFAATSSGTLHSLYQLLVRNVTWTSFAKYSKSYNGDLEGIHGTIHNQLGGRVTIDNSELATGHMTMTQFSAFDPSFWLHHANVDRVTAIWQALYDDVYVEPDFNGEGSYYQHANTTDTLRTPLAPFHSGIGEEMWNAEAARSISAFGYTYPELFSTNTDRSSFKATLREKINKLYNPSAVSPSNSSKHVLASRNANVAQVMSNVHADTALRLGVNNLEIQWYLRIRADNVHLNKLGVFFFVGEEPTDSADWSKANNLIGSYVPLFDSGSVSNHAAAFIDIPCTHTIAAAADRGLLRTILPEAAIPFIMSHVRAKVVHLEPMDAYNSVQVWIVSQRVQPRKRFSEFPQYEGFEEHDELLNIEMVGL